MAELAARLAARLAADLASDLGEPVEAAPPIDPESVWFFGAGHIFGAVGLVFGSPTPP